MSDFTLRDWFSVGFGVMIGAMTLFGWRRYWRHEIAVFDRPAQWFPWGDAVWRGMVRTFPSVGAIVFGWTLAFVALKLGPAANWPAAVGLAYWALALLLYVPGFVLFFTVAFLSWPMFLIPPHLRHQPGIFAEWGADLRRRWRRRSSDHTNS